LEARAETAVALSASGANAELEARAEALMAPSISGAIAEQTRAKTCRTCRRELPPGSFEKHRLVCRDCRRARFREARSEAVSARERASQEPPRATDHLRAAASDDGS